MRHTNHRPTSTDRINQDKRCPLQQVISQFLVAMLCIVVKVREKQDPLHKESAVLKNNLYPT